MTLFSEEYRQYNRLIFASIQQTKVQCKMRRLLLCQVFKSVMCLINRLLFKPYCADLIAQIIIWKNVLSVTMYGGMKATPYGILFSDKVQWQSNTPDRLVTVKGVKVNTSPWSSGPTRSTNYKQQYQCWFNSHLGSVDVNYTVFLCGSIIWNDIKLTCDSVTSLHFKNTSIK